MTTNRTVLACTGFTLEVLRVYCEEYDLKGEEGKTLAAALSMMHTDCSNEQLSVYFLGLFYEWVPPTTLSRRRSRKRRTVGSVTCAVVY